MTATSAASTRRARRVQGPRQALVVVRVDRFEDACTIPLPRVAVATRSFVAGGARRTLFPWGGGSTANVARAAAGAERCLSD